MPKFNKPLPEMLNAVWASEALSQNNVYPDIDYVEEGWLQIKPPYEYENAINYKHDQFIAHINQLGVVEWDSETEYQANKSYVQSGNLIYKCLQTHTGRSPSTAGNESFWELFEGNRPSTQTQRGTVRLASSSQAKGTSDSLVLTPKTLIDSLGGAVLSSPGEFKIPVNASGARKEVIVKFGTTPEFTLNGESRFIYFVQPFPSECLWFDIGSAGIVAGGNVPTSEGIQVTSYGPSGAQVSSNWDQGTQGVVRWIAIGY